MEQKKQHSVAREALDTYIKLNQAYNFCVQRTLSKYGLYEGQPALLFEIQARSTPTQNELALALGVSKASAGVSIRRMEKAGFLKRTRDVGDSRCIRVSLTKKGEEFARWCEIDMEMIANTLLEDFEAEERIEALNALERMYKGMDEMRERIKA
ncbi:MarR family winged helix-turn-helix transcriptional regulator [Eubacteriales bacterium OttesenSCG-928-K08]|nr:MarR family winged helix-turn-helix transcriptional regulator [Eubacteriales bacterium OttesenSCG-928-K08]